MGKVVVYDFRDRYAVIDLVDELNTNHGFGAWDVRKTISASDVARKLKNMRRIVWLIDSSVVDHGPYPTKSTGSVLICAKFMDYGDTRINAVSEIFKVHGNAVLAFYDEIGGFRVELIDALGNVWFNGFNMRLLASRIVEFVDWSKRSVLVRSYLKKETALIASSEVDRFLKIVRSASDKMMDSDVGRYFGSVSTRCQALFPSMSGGDTVLSSARDICKKHISAQDMIRVEAGNGGVIAYGERKPSVDAPIHLELYMLYENIKFLIHGHAYIEGCPTTVNYMSCGDMREILEVENIVEDKKCSFMCVNLRNHGFIVGADTLEKLDEWLETAVFVQHQGEIK